jgi:uncharacterized protein (DUF1501 family)
MQRREFIKSCGAYSALLAINPLKNLAFLNPANAQDEIFVLLFLHGGMDGLHFVAPVDDKNYIAARPNSLRLSNTGNEAGLMLQNAFSGFDFRMHPKAKGLKELYDANKLAIIHACGLTNGSRSHFDAIDMIERGISQKQNTAEGWLTRYLTTINPTSLLPAIVSGSNVPASLLGSKFVSSVYDPKEFKIQGDPRIAGLLKKMYKNETNPLLNLAGQKAISTMAIVQNKLKRDANQNPIDYQPEKGVEYPNEWYVNDLSKKLKNLAQIIKMDVGVHIAAVEFGGWDTHENQQYHFPQLIEGLSEALSAFYNDLHAYHNKLTVLVMSEFGRRLKANKSNGTDHGYGNVMLVLGGNVKGGKMYGKWNGLANEQLDKGVDLNVTTDYRTVLAEILQKQMQSNQLSTILPNFSPPDLLGFLG